MAKYDLFGAGAFPLFAAYANGKFLSYLTGARAQGDLDDSVDVPLPALGKVKVQVQLFLIGVATETAFVFALLPWRRRITTVFFQDLQVGEKWPVHVLVACMTSLLVVSVVAGAKLLVCVWRKARVEAEADLQQDYRVEDTVRNLVSEREDSEKSAS